MEVLVYLVLGLSIWILVPSERSALVGRVAERSAQGERRLAAGEDAEDSRSGVDVFSGVDTETRDR